MNKVTSKKELSETRGKKAGVKTMLLMLKIMGVNRACEFCWLISLFYVLFDRTARKCASYYLARRFPNCGPFRRFFHTWAMFTSQGQALIEAAASSSGQMQIVKLRYDRMERALAQPHGVILVCSHFGQWQGMMRTIDIRNRPAHLLIRPDRNANVDKFMAVNDIRKHIHVISTESEMGGILDAYNALLQGDVVCMMGDRCRENESVRIPFLGASARFPLAAYLLSARSGAPVIPIFAFREKRHRQMTIHFLEPIPPADRRTRREDLRPKVEIYVSELEKMAREHPYECFIFENIWSEEERQ